MGWQQSSSQPPVRDVHKAATILDCKDFVINTSIHFDFSQLDMGGQWWPAHSSQTHWSHSGPLEKLLFIYLCCYLYYCLFLFIYLVVCSVCWAVSVAGFLHFFHTRHHTGLWQTRPGGLTPSVQDLNIISNNTRVKHSSNWRSRQGDQRDSKRCHKGIENLIGIWWKVICVCPAMTK